MNGPSHYLEAERLLASRPGLSGATFRSVMVAPDALDVARAQAHALLALAAAQGNAGSDRDDWRAAAGGETP